jgi:hypothetical protein
LSSNRTVSGVSGPARVEFLPSTGSDEGGSGYLKALYDGCLLDGPGPEVAAGDVEGGVSK